MLKYIIDTCKRDTKKIKTDNDHETVEYNCICKECCDKNKTG